MTRERDAIYTHDGRSLTLKQWAAHLGIAYKALWHRVSTGMPPERAFVADPGRVTKRDPDRTLSKTCANCGCEFFIPRCRDARENCCSSACKSELRATKRAASIEERTRVCEGCGAKFVARAWQVANGIGRFCSVACNTAGREAGRSPAAVAKRAAQRKQKYLSGEWKPRRGPDHPRWKGGKKAYRERRQASGALLAKLRKYREANPEKVREWRQKRRGIGRLPRGTIQKIGASQKWKCVCCRASIRNAFHVDHVMPLALGGEHAPTNIQLLCGPCNVRKSAKHPVDFMQSRGFLL